MPTEIQKHDPTPNPGSKEAQKLGCICPVIDNNHGRSAPWPPDNWYFTVGCPVHMPVEEGDTRG